jgi:hypothetical protein
MCYHAEGEEFLACIVMGDETRIQKIHRMATHILSCQKKKFKSALSAGKLMLTLFWDMNGPILKHYQEKGETFNSVRYSTMLEENLKPAVRSCHRRGLLSKGVPLLHDNARPHTAAATVNTTQKVKFEIMNHPSYSPDHAPSNCHVFGMLKEALNGQRFHSDIEVKDTVHFWLQQQPKTFFLLEYRSLLEDVKSTLQKMVTAWKNNFLFVSVYMMCISILHNFPLLIEVPT